MKSFKLIVVMTLLFSACKQESDFEVGIIADCQYCDCESKGIRYYSKSPDRLLKAVNDLNQKELAYTIHLGDFIDQDFSSFDTVLPIWNKLKSKKYHVLGNHDFQVADSLKSKVPAKLDLTNRYYSFTKNNWRFIVLDGNDLSFHGGITKLKQTQTDSLYTTIKNKELSFAQTWNGGLSHSQLNWVKSELEKATSNNENVGFYCHFPVFPIEMHNLWNRSALVALIDNYSCVKLFFNGHNHAGAYALKNGVHYLTFKGMVDTESQSSYATASFSKDSVIIRGYGREISRNLPLK